MIDGQRAGNQVRILIVEDHQVVADGLTALLNDQPDMAVVGHAGSVAEAVSRAADLSPHVVLLDFRLSDGTGAEAAVQIHQVHRSAKLIFLTRDDSDEAHFMALQAGASGFLHKSKAASDVIDAVRAVAAGRTLIAPGTVATLLNRHREMDAQRESLTPREKEVLLLIAKGGSSREIAGKLGISYTTVRSHIRSLGSKLGVHSKLQAVVKARELSLID